MPFACTWCGRTSHNPGDARDGYCGHCHMRTGPDAFGECRLSPATLLTSPYWHYAGADAERTVWTWSPVAEDGVRTWVPEPSLGPFNASWSDSTLTLHVGTEIMARAIMELMPLPGPIDRAWSWPELYDAWAGRRGPGGTPWRPQAEPGLYRCRCGEQFEVPPGHPEPVLCSHHIHPVPMVRVGPGGQYWSPVAPRDAAERRYLELREHGASSMAARQLAEAEAAGLALSPAEWRSLVEAGTVGHAPDQDVIPEEDARRIDELVSLDDAQVAELYRMTTEFSGLVVPADAVAPPETGSGEDVLVEQIRRRSSAPPSWLADAVAVWAGCKDDARRRRSMAELAQAIADQTPQYPPAERGVDDCTAARWSPGDPGDITL